MFRKYSDYNEKPVWLVSPLLFNLYRYSIKRIRFEIRRTLNRLELAPYSKTLRRIFKDYHNIKVGMYTIGCFRNITFPPGTKIGRYSMVTHTAKHLYLDHPLDQISSHTMFHSKEYGFVEQDLWYTNSPDIGHDVFIGHQVILLPSVRKIGTGAVIGSGAVVSQDVPPYAVVVGNPGRVVRYRFGQKTINNLLESEWWEYSVTKIKSIRSGNHKPQFMKSEIFK